MIRVVNLYKERGNVYIGRAGKGRDGYWGNPVAVNRPCPNCGQRHTTGGATLPCYTQTLIKRFEDKEFKRRFIELAERAKKEEIVLECFCAPKPCHGQVMKRLLEDDNFIQKLKGG